MAIEKSPDPPGDDVPGWIMTFSDVITLLMTFFILLLTFATNQPETFDRVQMTLFSGGSSGFISDAEGMVKDSILMRIRARTGRLAREGSQSPPIFSDPELTALRNGIAGLEVSAKEDILSQRQIQSDLAVFVGPDGSITARGKQQLKMLAFQLRKLPLQLDVAISTADDFPAAQAILQQLTTTGKVSQAKVGLAVAPHRVAPGKVKMILAREVTVRGS